MADDGIAVDVQDDELPEYDEDRAKLNLNSPKGNTGNDNYLGDDNNNTMVLNLTVDDDYKDEDDENVTPNTKRDQMDVNSPRHKEQQQKWGTTAATNNAGLAGLVTQVPRDDANTRSDMAGGGGGVEALVTQVPRDDDETEQNIRGVVGGAGSSGICACFSCLWSCCSGPQAPAEVPMTAQNDYQSNGDAATSSKQQMSQPDGPLLEQGSGTGSGDKDEAEESVSSTDYDQALLPPPKPQHVGQKCLVLDLDETLVHSSFKPIPKPDFIIPVEIDRVVHHVYVLKRPYVDEFLLRASKYYEIVIFTASLSKYADPLLDKLDVHNVISHRLFRESCVIHGTAYVKDMRRIGRKLKDSIIVDNSPPSYLFQPTNAVPIASWFDDQNDTQLLDFCAVLETTVDQIDDVRKILDANNKSFRWLCNQAHRPLTEYTVRNDRVNRQ